MRVLFGSLNQRALLALRGIIRRFFPQHDSDTGFDRELRMALLETLLFCVVTLGVRYWFNPNNPFGVEEPFPWLWIPPALLAMRYGTAIGVVSVIFMVLGWFVFAQLGIGVQQTGEEFPKVYFMGGLLLILVCGQFSDMWNAHIHRLRIINGYLDERLGTLTKNHYLLRLSHDRLEQDLLGKPMTLRETLIRLRDLTSSAEPGVLAGAQELIQLLGQSFQLEVAAIYRADASGQLLPKEEATLGHPSALSLEDPLLRYALESQAMAHIQTSNISAETRDGSIYLVCAPLLTSGGQMVGMMVIEKLPFFALNDNALQQIAVFTGFYADGVVIGEVIRPVLQIVPNCPLDLALDMVRLHRIRERDGVESTLVALVFAKDGRAMDMFEQVRHLNRGADITWHIATERHNALFTLLTLGNSLATEGYLLRIESALKRQFHVDFVEGGVVMHLAPLGLMSPGDTLQELIERCEL